ncbi:MAG: hypothetical protein ACTSYM_14040 [Candidatus Baldrarchaeia archaeon]
MCNIPGCKLPPVVICENCGLLVCEKHVKTCFECRKPFCIKCSREYLIKKGLISKKYYCPEHAPQK